MTTFAAPHSPVVVLLVEDNAADFKLAADALARCPVPIRVVHAEDGEQALACLRQQGEFQDAPPPAFLLLDINLPGLNGIEVLREIRHDGRFASIPVLIFSGSGNEDDVRRAYAQGCSCYVVKPSGYEETARTLCAVVEFWTQVARLPQPRR